MSRWNYWIRGNLMLLGIMVLAGVLLPCWTSPSVCSAVYAKEHVSYKDLVSWVQPAPRSETLPKDCYWPPEDSWVMGKEVKSGEGLYMMDKEHPNIVWFVSPTKNGALEAAPEPIVVFRKWW